MAEDDQDAKLIAAFLAKQGAKKLPDGTARGVTRFPDGGARRAAYAFASLEADIARVAKHKKRPSRGHRKTDPH